MKKIIIMFTLIILTAVTGCSSNYSDKSGIYENLEFIASDGDCYSYLERIEDQSDEDLSISFTAFYGKETLLRLEGTNGTRLQLAVISNIKRGDFKVCVVGPEMAVDTILQGSGELTASVRMSDGEYRVVIAGINSTGEITIAKEIFYED